MARFEFKLPDIGEGVTEGEIVGWLARVGERLSENQDMVEVMTDKATVTIGCPKAGTVLELRGAVGETVPVGSVIVVLDTAEGQQGQVADSTHAAVTSPMGAGETGPAASAVGDIRSVLPGVELLAQSSSVSAKSSGYFSEQPLAAPATRKLARELGVDLKRVEPTGKGGRVTREDVEQASRSDTDAAAAAEPSLSVGESRAIEKSGGTSIVGAAAAAAPVETRQPIRGIRKRIAENMARSKRTAAHFTYVDDCDASQLMALRDRLAPHAEAKGVKLTYLPFIVKAVVEALKAYPAVNALVDDAMQEIVLRGNYDIGIATSTDQGLVVPVLRGADRLGLLDVAREIARLAAQAKNGRISPQDLGGSSFTITSLGRLGGLFATPVINYPEVAILGIHEIKKRPVVRNDQIVIGAEMHLSLSFDHRIIDGHVGAAFAQEIIGLLEVPERLLIAG